MLLKKKITIYINGNFLAQPVTGVQRFGIELLKALDELSALSACRFIILTYTANLYLPYQFKHIIVQQTGIFKGKLWEQTSIWRASFGRLLITFAGGAPVFKQRQLFTIHDAAIYDRPAGFSPVYRWWYYTLNAIISKSAKYLITVSDFSKTRLSKKLHIPADKIKIIHNAGNHFSAITADESILNTLPSNKKIVLCVGSLNPNKNFKQVIQVALRLQQQTDVHFVVVGNINNKVFSGSAAHADAFNLPNITYAGAVSDAALKALYSHAYCFLFLSLYEGFGIPVAEAMTCGCPVVCANTSCLPELFEPYCCMVNATDTAEIAERLSDLLNNQQTYLWYRQKAHDGAKHFNWTLSAQRLLQLIHTTLTE